MKIPATLLIAFNRPKETKEVFDAIRNAKPRKLYIATDGARITHPNDTILLEETRKIFDNIDWECEVKTLHSEVNQGCKVAVSSAIDWFFKHEEVGIILEDDCKPSLSFFHFCDEMLNRYRDDNRVMQISGSHLVSNHNSHYPYSYYFTRLNDIWGWATWRRAWKHFSLDMPNYLEFKKGSNLQNYGLKPEITKWLQSYLDDTYFNDSRIWSIQWTYAMIVNNGLSINPSSNLVENIGFTKDGTGANSSFNSFNLYNNFKIQSMGNISHPPFILPSSCLESLRFNIIKKTDPRLFLINIIIKWVVNKLRLLKSIFFR